MPFSRVYFFLLFLLLITGVFASMAQNTYGRTLIGLVAAGFSLLFAFLLLGQWKDKDSTWVDRIETLCLTLVSAIYTLQLFSSADAVPSFLFPITIIMLALIYSFRAYQIVQTEPALPLALRNRMVGYYGLVILCLISWILRGQLASLSMQFIFLLILLLGWFTIDKRTFPVLGKEVTFLQQIGKYQDHSWIVLTIFLLFNLYIIGVRSSVVPHMYNNEYPRHYYNMLDSMNNSSTPDLSRNKIVEFKKQYEEFIKKHDSTRD